MQTIWMFCLSLAMLMASLLNASPVIALSHPIAQPQTFLGSTSERVPASTQATNSKLQSAIGSVTGEGGQTIDQMTQGLMKEKGT